MRVQYTVNSLGYSYDIPLQPILAILLSVILGYFTYTWVTAEDESAIDFEVEIPAQCKKGWLETAAVLESPSILVRLDIFLRIHQEADYNNRHHPPQPYNATVLQTANFSAASTQLHLKASTVQ